MYSYEANCRGPSCQAKFGCPRFRSIPCVEVVKQSLGVLDSPLDSPEAIKNADSPNNLRLRIKLRKSESSEAEAEPSALSSLSLSLESIEEEEEEGAGSP
jgi:hypothetical protein